MMNNYANMLISDSPHGGRSPIVSRQDSSGTLKTTISLGKTPTIIQTGPFYSMKEAPGKGELTGDKDLMTEYGLDHTLTKFKEKKVKETLASFLPNLPVINDQFITLENSTLMSIIEKPPICGKELIPLTSVQLAGFRLHPGPLPEQYRALNVVVQRKHKNKHKRNKARDGVAPQETSPGIDSSGLETYEKKHKKQKRHEDDKERKKRKKEKKRKKKSHSPDPQSNLLSSNNVSSSLGGGSGGVVGLGGGLGSGSLGVGLPGSGNGVSGSLGGSMGLVPMSGAPPMQNQLQQHLLMQLPLGTSTMSQQGQSAQTQQQQQLLQNQMQMGGGGGGGSSGGGMGGLAGMGGVGGNVGGSATAGGGLLSSAQGLSALLGTNTGMSAATSTATTGGGVGGSGMLTNNSNNAVGSNAGPGGLMMSQQMSLF